MQKAKDLSKTDLDGRFIYYWIAFNALYGQPKYLTNKKGPEEKDIERFIALMIELDPASRIPDALDRHKNPINDLIDDNYLSDDCWTGWAERGLESLSERDKYCFLDRRQHSGLAGLFRRIYVLRKQLFHGCSSDKGSKNRDALARAVALLEVMVPIFHDIVFQNAENVRMTKFFGELPYPPTVGGTG